MKTIALTIALGSDHGGFPLKEALKRHLGAKGYPLIDVGTHSTETCDYPVFAAEAARAVASGRAWRAVVIDGAGIGSAMAANKIPGVRAGMAFNEATARNAGEHNGANVLTLGAGYLDEATAKVIVDTFLGAECTVDRHQRRVAMIDALPDGIVRSSPMAASTNEHERLVEQISRVLSSNPRFLTVLGAAGRAAGDRAAGGPGNVCMTCNQCDNQCAQTAPDVVRSLVRFDNARFDNARFDKGASRVSSRLGASKVPKDLAKLIDHTLLKAEATYADIDQLCAEAREHGFASVCVNPVHVRRCALALRGSDSLVCTVIGFPLGANAKEIKAMEARRAVREGAREVDMVINIGSLKSGDIEAVYEDIRAVREVAHEGGAILKVIIETALLTDEEKVQACLAAKRARADFVKTSTGFSKSGATAADVALMARAVDQKLGVKASGGVKSADDAQKLIGAGATRIGASVGIKIVQEARGEAVAQSSGGGY